MTAHIDVNRPCYVIASKVPSMVITGSGFAPRSNVLITSTANIDVSTHADRHGDISVRVSAPAPYFARPAVKTYLFEAADEDGSITARRLVRVAPYGALHGATAQAPGLTALTERTSWSFSGFAPGREIYAHYTLDGRQVALAEFGRAHGDCGLLRTRAPLYPATPHRAGYQVQFDGVERYSPATRPRIMGTVRLAG